MTRGQLIRHHRRERFLTQKAAAVMVGVTPQQVGLWEKDKIETIQEQNIERIARVLDIDPERLRRI